MNTYHSGRTTYYSGYARSYVQRSVAIDVIEKVRAGVSDGRAHANIVNEIEDTIKSSFDLCRRFKAVPFIITPCHP